MGALTRDAIELVTAVSLVGSTLAGCAPQGNGTGQNKEKNNHENESPITEQIAVENIEDERITLTPNPQFEYTTQTPEWSPINNPSTTDVTVSESQPLNYEILDIRNWADYEVDDVENKEPGYQVQTNSAGSFIYLIPLRKDNFLDDRDTIIQEITTPANVNFEIAQMRTITGPNNQRVKIGLIANTYGANLVSAVLLEATDESGITESFATEVQEEAKTVSYIVTEDFIYPNKVMNTLLALKNISEYQDVNGFFEQGKEYSYIDLIGLKDPTKQSEYKYGLTSSKAVVIGGGVCAMATGMSSLVHVQEDPNYKIQEQWAHPTRYAQGPFSPSEFLVDAAVEYGENLTYDFRWIQGKGKYLHINTFLTPSDIPFEGTEPRGVGGKSDAVLVVSLSFSDTPPSKEQTKEIENLLQNYQAFRESQHQQPMSLAQANTTVTKYPMEETLSGRVGLIYNIEDISIFEKEIQNTPYLKDILTLKQTVNSYPSGSETPLRDYLTDSDWYRQYVTEENKDQVDKIIRYSTGANIKGQPLQCVEFAMMASLLYPELSSAYVGSAAVFSARELIPPELLKYQSVITGRHTNYGAYAIAGEIPLEGYEPGDLFVRTDGTVIQSTGEPSGHIGVILKKIIKPDGRIVLLAADSNRHNNGIIKVFVVDQYNMDEIFGGQQRYIIRKAKS